MVLLQRGVRYLVIYGGGEGGGGSFTTIEFQRGSDRTPRTPPPTRLHLYFLQPSKCSIPPSSSSRATSTQSVQILFLISLVRGPNSGLVLLYGFPSILPWRKPSCCGSSSKDMKPYHTIPYQCLILLGK